MRETEQLALAQGRTKSELEPDALRRQAQRGQLRELQRYGRRNERPRFGTDRRRPAEPLLEEAIDGRFDLIFPELVRAELHRVLTDKLGFTDEKSSAACALLAQLAVERPDAPPSIEPVTGDPADDAILAAAVHAGVDVLATGDRKHLLPIGEHRGVKLRTPQALLAELLNALRAQL
jgi:predicted nucleic acid-binding protein